MRVLAVAFMPEYVATKVRFTPPAGVAPASGVQLKLPAVKVAPAGGAPCSASVGVPEGCVALTVKESGTPCVAETRTGAEMVGGGMTAGATSRCVVATAVTPAKVAVKVTSAVAA